MDDEALVDSAYDVARRLATGQRRRLKEGLTKREAIRCLTRYVARDLYRHLPEKKWLA